MSVRAVVLSVAALLVAGAVGVGATLLVRGAGPGAEQVPDPASAARTAFPGLTAPTGDPELPGLATARPRPGTVAVVEGPFDDRLDLSGLRLAGNGVTGTVTVTSDVSELIELQVLAGFYDADGKLLGTGRFTHHAGEEDHGHTGPPSEEESFEVAVPDDLGGTVAAAAVGVPVLVNE
ncbi:hypothetical protein C8K30_107322 [Promicromonospora sp. AC04]|uniref:hypothetical protein n=1 Tax=Promicromonospora sp. AC04 TaxID=2135723 RepID=UPI000D370CDE|nr:hypothetical protein [Promicromonospora sp. AC04]PUB25569.1 hypothetical protein C8K30_107322 [Promicromonospora sp. AC04]